MTDASLGTHLFDSFLRRIGSPATSTTAITAVQASDMSIGTERTIAGYAPSAWHSVLTLAQRRLGGYARPNRNRGWLR